MSKKEQKDERFRIAGEKIRAGKIKRFSDIYKIVPPSVLAKALAHHVARFLEVKQNDPYFFRVGELLEMAGLFEVEPAQLIALMEPDIKAAEKTRTHTSNPKQSPSPEYLERARQAKEMYATGNYTKTELAVKLNISRPTLDGYLKVEIGEE